MLERDIERWFVDELRKAGFLCFKFVSPANPGVPDRLVVCPDGAIMFVELKTKKGKLSKQQEVCIKQLTKHGQRVAVARGFDEARSLVHALVGFHGFVNGGAERGQI